jgi:hypothetical protein
MITTRPKRNENKGKKGKIYLHLGTIVKVEHNLAKWLAETFHKNQQKKCFFRNIRTTWTEEAEGIGLN